MLASRLLGEGFRAYAVRLGGAVALPWAYATVLMLLEEKHYPHVIMLLDADSNLEPQIDRKRHELEAMLEEHRLGSDEVTVCLAVPEIEAWLLAAYVERPEESRDPKGDLAKHLHARRVLPQQAAELARTLDIDVARRRAPSFDTFVRSLTQVAERLRQASAA
ncbi:MAG: hypothetical protein QM820_14050 [Minicystis sp.]